MHANRILYERERHAPIPRIARVELCPIGGKHLGGECAAHAGILVSSGGSARPAAAGAGHASYATETFTFTGVEFANRSSTGQCASTASRSWW